MSVYKIALLYCDSDDKNCPDDGGCYDNQETRTASAVRRDAKKNGWKRIGGKDYCEYCARALAAKEAK